jgi:RsbRD-like negative regulator of sigma factor
MSITITGRMLPDTKILAELSDYLLKHRGKIMKEWLDAVQRNPDMASSNHIGDAELVDHLPKVLKNIAERLKNPQLHYDYTAVSHLGRSHGKFRWRQGYRLEEVIREAGIIRWILTRNRLDAFERQVRRLNKRARRTAEHIIHDAVEDLLADSAEQFLREQEKRMSDLTSQLANAVAELRQQKRGTELAKQRDDSQG